MVPPMFKASAFMEGKLYHQKNVFVDFTTDYLLFFMRATSQK